jgi:tRNA G37 N-methylase TrmD
MRNKNTILKMVFFWIFFSMEDNGIQSMDVDEENVRIQQSAEEKKRAEDEKKTGGGEGFLLKAMKGFDMLRERVRANCCLEIRKQER